MAHRVSATNETGVAPLTTREEASSSSTAMDPTEEALRWVELVTDIQRPEGVSLQDWLRSGVVLCELVNLIAPASVARISESDMPFKQMGNIDNYVRRPPERRGCLPAQTHDASFLAPARARRVFPRRRTRAPRHHHHHHHHRRRRVQVRACEKYGVPAQDLFMTVDLFEGKNVDAVVRNLHSLGRVCQSRGFHGPTLGARLSTRNERRFSEAQIAEARAIPSRWVNSGRTLQEVAAQVSCDDYVLQEKLGEGSFGKVFKARHTSTNQNVAIKIIRASRDSTPEVAQEIAVLKQCSCENIVRCHAALQAGDDLWLVLEYCAGGALHDIMQAIGTSLTERQISAACAGSMLGVRYLHAQVPPPSPRAEHTLVIPPRGPDPGPFLPQPA